MSQSRIFEKRKRKKNSHTSETDDGNKSKSEEIREQMPDFIGAEDEIEQAIRLAQYLATTKSGCGCGR